MVDSGGSNQLCPRAGSSPHSASAYLPGGIVKASRSLAGILPAWGCLCPGSPSSQSASFEMGLRFFPSTGERGNGYFLFCSPSSHSLVPCPATFLSPELSKESSTWLLGEGRPLAQPRVSLCPKARPQRSIRRLLLTPSLRPAGRLRVRIST